MLLLPLLVACTATPDEVLRFALPGAPATLDPRLAADAAAARICRLLYLSPIDFDAHFRPRPALAKWQAITLQRYRVNLRPEARFHDGTPITAEDVAATYRSILEPERASPHRASFAHVQAIEVLTPRILEFRLSRPDPLFPGLLSVGVLKAEEARRAGGEGALTGSGAFRLVAPPSPRRVSLARVGDGMRVDFMVVANETTRALMLARGELDLAQGALSPELASWLAQRPGISVTVKPGTVYSYLGFNLARGPTRDPHVRQAIALAIDRAALIRHAFRGKARLADSLLVPEHWTGVGAGPATVPKRAEARRLLADLGYTPEHPLVISYKTTHDFFRRRLATMLQDQLAGVGIRLDIRSHDWGTFFADVRSGRFEMYALSWVGLQSPDIYRQAFHSEARPPGGANRGRYENARVDALLAAAAGEASPPRQAAYYRDIQAILNRELPYVSLWFEDTVVVRGARALGYDTDLHGNYDGLARLDPDVPHASSAAH